MPQLNQIESHEEQSAEYSSLRSSEVSVLDEGSSSTSYEVPIQSHQNQAFLSTETLFHASLFFLSSVVFVGQYLLARTEMENDPSWTVAKSFAEACSTTIGVVLVPALLIPRMRVMTNSLSRIWPSWDKLYGALHGISALSATLLAVLHGAVQIYRRSVGETGNPDGPGYPLGLYRRKLYLGLYMLTASVITSGLALFRHRLPSYRTFFTSHILLASSILGSFMFHNPHANPISLLKGKYNNLPSITIGLSFFALLVDRVVERWRFTYKAEVLEASHAISPDLTQLTIAKPEGFQASPGDIIEVNISSLGYEWHPFSLANNPEASDVIQLLIGVQGRWTQGLNQLIDTLHHTYLKIRGPQYSALQQADSEPQSTFVSTGVGINGLLSMMSAHTRFETVHLIAREKALWMAFCKRLAALPPNADIGSTIHFYYTGPLSSHEKRQHIEDVLFQSKLDRTELHFDENLGEHNYDSSVESSPHTENRYRIFCHTHRPDTKAIVSATTTEKLFYSGNRVVGDLLQQHCQDANLDLITEPRLHNTF